MSNGGILLPRRCGTHDVSTGDRARMAELERDFMERTRIAEADLSITIKVAFIHIVDGDKGKITEAQRAKQIDVMNQVFAPMRIDFTYDENAVVKVDNPQFFTMGHDSIAERNCKTQHQVLDPERGLNFYTAAPGGGLLGWATFPYEMAGDPKMDGVIMLHGTLPGGGAQNYDLGLTAAHEVGHWLGLYHTFQDGCMGEGDEVDDSPAHGGPNYGKPDDAGQPYNLCPDQPAGSKCPIHNYMNYVDDEWMTEFTAGQKDRVWAQIGMFRRDLISGAAREAAPEMGETIVW